MREWKRIAEPAVAGSTELQAGARYYLGTPRHLPAAEIVELYAGHPAAKPMAEHAMMTVADEVNRFYHDRLTLRP